MANLYTHYDVDILRKSSKFGIVINTVYPNPVQNDLYIDFTVNTNSNELDFQLFDINGCLIKAWNFKGVKVGKHDLNVSLDTIAEGMYFVRLNQSNAIKILVY